MGWPLIVSLAGTAAQAESESHAENVMDEYAREQAERQQAMRNRLLDEQVKSDQQRALAAALKAGPQPVGVGPDVYIPGEVEKPNMAVSNILGGLGGLAQQLGQYYDTRVNQPQSGQNSAGIEPFKYSGTKTKSMSVPTTIGIDYGAPSFDELYEGLA